MIVRSRPAALVACLLGALLPLLAPACAKCPRPRSVRALPESIRDRLELTPSDVGTIVYDLNPPNGRVRVEVLELARVDSGLIWDEGRELGAELPLRRSRHIWAVPATFLSVEGERRDVPLLRVDTGLSGSVSMSRDDGAGAGVFLIGEVPQGESHTAFGPKLARLGVFASIDLGPVQIAPAGAQVECAGPSFAPNIGMDALDTFGHVIFDWDARRLILLPKNSIARTQRLLERRGWASSRWSPDPVIARRDSLRARGSGRREYEIDKRDRWTTVTLGGQTYNAIIDTGFSSDVFAFEPTHLSGDHTEWRGTGFGRSATFDVVHADAPLTLAGIEFERPAVLEPRRELADYAQRGGVDVIIGLGVLERFPLWLDFERNELRFWVSDDPLPRFLDATRAAAD